MRAVIQRVSRAFVTIDGAIKSSIGPGLLVLLGVGNDDTAEDADKLARKTANLRIFNDDEGVMNRSVIESSGDVIVVSQFTLLACTKKGNRPSYINAARHELAVPMYELFCRKMSELIGKPVGMGVFGADMKIELVNDGPVTICMDTKAKDV